MLIQEVRDALGDVVKELGVAPEWYWVKVRAWTVAALPRDCAEVSLGGVKTFDPRGCNCMLDLSAVCFSSALRPCASSDGESCRLQSPEQGDTTQADPQFSRTPEPPSPIPHFLSED